MLKVLERSGSQGPLLNIIKAIQSKLIVNIKKWRETWINRPKLRDKTRLPSLSLYNIVLEVLAREIRQ